MNLPTPIGGEISYEEFSKMKDAFADKNPDGPFSIVFSVDVIKRLLNTGGERFRVHFGIGADGKTTVMMTTEGGKVTLDEARSGFIAMDRGQACPPYC